MSRATDIDALEIHSLAPGHFSRGSRRSATSSNGNISPTDR